MDHAKQLIERDEQLVCLSARLARAATGRGGLVLVTGEAGVGKTRLVRAALERAGIAAVAAESTQEENAPYAPIAALARARIRAGGEPAPPPLPELSAPTPGALAEALSAWFEALGEDHPTAVFLDDVHWADAATLDLLPRLAGDLEHAPVLVIAAYRSDEVPRGHPVRKLRVALRRSGRLEEIDVPPLGAAATAELAGRILGSPVAPALGATLHDRTQGVPFFVEELTAVLAVDALVTSGPDGLTLVLGRDVPLPDTVRDAVLLRAEQLGAATRAALEVASVAGLQFELRLLEELASADVEEAVALGLVAEPEDGKAAFRHTLVREAVYADVPWGRRRSLHRRVAEWLEGDGAPPRLLAAHWLAAHEIDRARAALLAAAEASCVVHAYRDASAALRTALELWPDEERETRLDVIDRLARCAERAGEIRDAVRLWEGMLRELGPDGDMLRIAAAQQSLAAAYRLLGDRERAASARAEAAATFTAAGAFADAFETRLNLVWDYETNTDGPAFEILDAADRDAECSGRLDLVARARSLRAHILARRGRFDDASPLAWEALELARSSGVATAIFDAYWYLAAIGVTRADYGGAIAALEEAADFCRSTGLREDEELCVACLAKILAKQGDWDRSLRLALETLDSTESPSSCWGALWAAGFIQVARGRTSDGRPLLTELVSIGRRFDFVPAHVEGLQALALADELDGDLDAAAAHNRELLDAARRRTTDAHHFAPTLRWAATFFASQKDAEHVNECADVLADIAVGFGTADALAALAHALGEAAHLAGHGREAAREFGRALELLDEVDAPFEIALTKLRAGPAFAAADERDMAVDCLVDAYRRFRALGARQFAVRAAAALEDLGEQVDRRLGRRAAGELERGGLTRRELEVLRLVAVGRTNAEIASSLVLSPRTVEMHVRNTMGKLGCRSRTEATSRAYALGFVESGRPHVTGATIATGD